MPTDERLAPDLPTPPAGPGVDGALDGVPESHLPVCRDALVADGARAGVRVDARAHRQALRVTAWLALAAAALWTSGLAPAALAVGGGAVGAASLLAQALLRARAHRRARHAEIAAVADALVVHLGLRGTVTVLADPAARRGPIAALVTLAREHADTAGCLGGHSLLCRHRRGPAT